MNELELRDIHLPDASLWWPPAPGWWLLPLLVLLLIALGYGLWRYLRRRPLRRQALIELDRIRRQASEGLGERDALAALATLLRRTLISYCGRRDYAASTGAEWSAQLNAIASAACFDEPQLRLLARDRYRRDCRCDLQPLFAASERWIKSLPRSAHAAG